MTFQSHSHSTVSLLLLAALLSSCVLPTLELNDPDEPPLLPDKPAVVLPTGTATGPVPPPATLPGVVPVAPVFVDTMPCSTNNGGCDTSPMATCTNVNAVAKCACPEGYDGNGLGDSGCTPTRTCTNNNGGCDTSPMAACSEAGDNKVNCACPDGYRGTGLGDDGCIDIDECASDNGGCDTSPKATCTNTPGGRGCACPSGYSGAGIGEDGCADTDECASNNGGCDTSPMATCVNTASGRTCNCPSGYSGTGIGASGCTDADECLTNNGGCDTSPAATCTNTGGSRSCSCPSGYTGSGIGSSGCTDVNECVTNNGGCDTSPMATCTNTVGGRTCTCPSATGTEYIDGVETSRLGSIQCERYWTRTGGVWDYGNQITWEYGTQATYDECRGTYHDRTDGVAGEACTLAEARTYCANYSADGGWRLPDFIELLTITESTGSPAIRTDKFGASPSTHFWTSTAGEDSTTAFYVDFNDGSLNTEAPTMRHDVRCVRDW